SLDFVVVNNSNTTRSFEFMAISSDPSVVPNPANPPGQSIGAHAQVTVTVSVTVSASASDADLSNVTLVATDADAPELSGDASTAVQVVVVVENRPPLVSLSCPNQVARNTLYSCTATFSDPDGNLSHTSWGALSLTSKTFTSSAVPTIEQQVITVFDLGGLSATAAADVEGINHPPEVTLICPDTAYTNEPFTCQAWADDPEGDPVFKNWSNWTRSYSFGTSGRHSVSITVWDSYDGSSTAQAVVWVEAANMAPIATVICNPAEAHVGLVSTCELGGSDPDDDWPLTPSWSSCSPFMSTGPSCTSEQTVVLGTLTVRGYVTDSKGLASPIDSAQIVGTNT